MKNITELLVGNDNFYVSRSELARKWIESGSETGIFNYCHIDSIVNLDNYKFSANPENTTYITYNNLTPQEGTPDILYYEICFIQGIKKFYTHGRFYNTENVSEFPYSGSVYGVQWDTANPSPECTRIGNLSLHATLPVQSQMVGGTLDDLGRFTEFTNQSDWTSETRDGSIGQVMVRIPRFWWKFETLGTINRVLMSAEPVIGFKEVPMHYVSAYEASLQRSTNKLSSVVNSDPDYRGGNNQSAWDSEDTAGYNGESHRSLLGRPASYISLTDFRTYARNRNVQADTDWNCMMYLTQKVLYWLYVTEYATLNSQKAYNAALSAEGYRQGGLGAGVTNWTESAWESFNNSYPFIPCGWTDEFGNSTGVKNYVVKNVSGSSLLTASVPRYRGIENPFGHLWKWIDGILVDITTDLSSVYVCYDTVKFSSISFNEYEYVTEYDNTRGYIKDIYFGNNGDIIPINTSGSSSTYYCDLGSSATINQVSGLRIGGNSFDNANCGFLNFSTVKTPVTELSTQGTRLTYLPSQYNDTIISVAKFKSVVPNTATSIIFGRRDYDVTGWTLLDYIGSRGQIAVFNQGTEYLVLNIKNKAIYAPSDCTQMFNNYSSLVTLEFDNFNTENVTNMYYMFTNCRGLTSLDLSNFDTAKVTEMRSMFSGCSSLTTIISNTFNTVAIENSNFMFNNCTGLVGGNGTTYNSSHITAEYARIDGEGGLPGYFTDPYRGGGIEEHEWLKATMPINSTNICILPINSSNVSYTVKFNQLGNSPVFLTDGYKYYKYYNDQTLQVWESGNSQVIYVSSIDSNTYIVNSTSEELLINGIQVPKYGFPISSINFTNAANGVRDTIQLLSKVYIDGVLTYVPVRLTATMPKNHTWDNKPHYAGECGMWDMVNKKFYGNANTVGTFTVED